MIRMLREHSCSGKQICIKETEDKVLLSCLYKKVLIRMIFYLALSLIEVFRRTDLYTEDFITNRL